MSDARPTDTRPPSWQLAGSIARAWEGQPRTSARSQSIQELETILLAIAPVLGFRPVDLRGALLRGDARAINAIMEIQGLANTILKDMIDFVAMSVEDDEQRMALAQIPFLEGLARAVHDEPALGQADYFRAILHRRNGQLSQAIDAFRRALEHGGDDDFRSRNLSRLGALLRIVGDYDEAAACLEGALALETRTEGKVRILGSIAVTLRMLGEFGKATEIDLWAARLRGGENDDGYALDAAAQQFALLGDHAWSLTLNERAKLWFGHHAPIGLAMNAEIKASLLQQADRAEEAASAFRDALMLHWKRSEASINRGHYENGWRRSQEVGEAAHAACVEAYIAAQRSGDRAALDHAIELAARTGDAAIELRARAERGGLCFDDGQLADAAAELEGVSARASDLGIAMPEYSALVTLSAIGQSGGEVSQPPLAALCRARYLRDVMAGFLAKVGLSPARYHAELADTGAIEGQLASYATARSIWPVAADLYEQAAAQARLTGDRFRLVNRLVGLHRAARDAGQTERASRAGAELRSLAEQGGLPDRAMLVAARALEHDDRPTDPASAKHWIETAVDCAESIRAGTASTQREAVDRQWRDVYGTLAQARREAGDPTAAFAAIQLGQERDFAETLAARAGRTEFPLRLETVQACLDGRHGLLDVAIERDGIALYLVSPNGLEAHFLPCNPFLFVMPDFGDVQERAKALLTLVRDDPILAAIAARCDSRLAAGSTLFLAPDARLGNLPWQAILVGGRAWSESRQITLVPAAAALLTRPRPATGRVLVMGDARGDLPAAREECSTVASMYGTRSLLGQECSVRHLREALRAGPLDVVHLATHGRGNPHHGGLARLCMTDDEGRPGWMDLTETLDTDWDVGVVVLSGCSTGLIGRKDGTQATSIAEMVLRAGARTVIACLWPVGDAAAQTVMEAFHRSLRQHDHPSSMTNVVAALGTGREAFAASNGRVTGTRDGSNRPTLLPEDVARELDKAAFVVLGAQHPFS